LTTWAGKAIDVQTNIGALLAKGVTVEIGGMGQIAKGVVEIDHRHTDARDRYGAPANP
jgi:hypothetical protein